MLYNLYTFSHETWNLCFWTLLSAPVAAAMVVMILIHGHNQKKRRKDFDRELDNRLR